MKHIIILLALFSITASAAITYPVDVNSTWWSFYSVSAGAVVKHKTRWPNASGDPLQGAEPDIVPLLEVRVPRPPFDPLTEKLEPAAPVTDVTQNTHTHSWNVVALSQDEINRNAERGADQAERVALRNLRQAIRNGNGNNSQRLRRLERAVAFLLKEILQND